MTPRAQCLSIVVATVGFVAGASGQEPVTTPRPELFRYERPIVAGGPGPSRLEIDVPLVAGGSPFRVRVRGGAGDAEPSSIALGGLSDLRIYDGDREVPYLLVEPPSPEPTWADGQIRPVAATKRTSGFEVDLGRSLAIDRLRVSGLPAPFLKRVVLEGSGDRARWTVLAAEGTLFDLPNEKLRRLEIEMAQGDFRYLRVTWDDRTSGRVPSPRSVSARLVPPGSAPQRLRAPVSFERRPSEPGKSRYRLGLPGARLPVTAIELSVAGGNVLREARVTEPRLVEGQVVPVPLGSATLHRAVRGEVAAAELRIPIGAPAEARLDLTIDDGNNPPLELTAVSAVFAELPWIYFEASGHDTLLARFGYRDVTAPRYDLEALRDSIPKLRPVGARWGELVEKNPAGAIPPPSLLPGAGVPIDVTSFVFSRRVASGKPGLTAVPLDAAVLAHSRFVDVRLAGPDGRQIPYLLEKLDEPLSADLELLETVAPGARDARETRGRAGAQTSYRLRLPYANLPAARLVLGTRLRVFERRVSITVERSPANPRQQPWTERVADAAWRHADPETPAPELALSLPPLDTAEARLIVDEGDNSPLPLERPRLLLPSYRIRFFRETESDLALLYGQRGLGAPRYDLTLLAPRLVGAAADEVRIEPEVSASPSAATLMPTLVFWAGLGVAVVVLLLLIARLVGNARGA